MSRRHRRVLIGPDGLVSCVNCGLQERSFHALYRGSECDDQRDRVAVPSGRVINVTLTDPQTGYRFCVQRRRGFLTLIVAEPVVEIGEETATVRRYLLALLGVPSHVPLTCHVEPVDAPMTWTALNEALRGSAKTGGMDTSIVELEQLLDQVDRLATFTGTR